MTENRYIRTDGGRYIEIRDNSTYIENYSSSQGLADAAAEIQRLLEQLDKTYSADTTTGKMTIATKAIEQIENDTALTQRILSALKAGGVSSLESFLNHPAASFVIGALEDWQQNKQG
jgi:hypothetical protein